MMPGQIAFTRTPSRAELRRHRARERVDAGLRRRVRRGARGHHLPADRRDVDDAAALALRDELLAERAAHVEGAVEVHVDHRAPLVDGRGRRPARGRRRAPRRRCSRRCRRGRARRAHVLGERVDRVGVGHVADDGRARAGRARAPRRRPSRCRASRRPARRRGSARAARPVPVSTTSHPARASSTAIGRPIERMRPAPVTTATLPSSPVENQSAHARSLAYARRRSSA